MTSRVYHLHSTIELPLEELEESFEDPELPEEIDDIDVTRRNNTLIISAVAPEGTVGKYTPTAQIKGTVTETRVIDEDADPLPPPIEGVEGAQWEGEAEQPTKLIEMAAFKGEREAILQNTALQFPMFEVLCDIARRASAGTLTAIAVEDDELKATRIVDGEDRPATIEIVEEHVTETIGRGVDWRDNKYIR
ncbi:MAG: hypothetical protein R3324_06145 [Halobacteriales archaeon]|nr:hypothetical protein [Halobacteriales archaeon]